MKTPLILAAITAFAMSAISAIAEDVDVYLLGGQSNMQGSGRTSHVEKSSLKATPNTFFFTGDKFEPLVPGETLTSTTSKGRFGPELGFAMNLESDQPVYLVKYHTSGMPLDPRWNGYNWNPSNAKTSGTNFYPGDSLDGSTTGKLYKKMIERFQKAITAIEAEGNTPVIKGFLWMQGEQDSKAAGSANDYAKNLNKLIRRLEEDMGVKEIPTIYGQVLPYEPGLERFTHREEIRQSMANADCTSGHPDAIHGASMVSTDDMPLLKDNLHYDGNGQLMLGKAMAEKMKWLREKHLAR